MQSMMRTCNCEAVHGELNRAPKRKSALNGARLGCASASASMCHGLLFTSLCHLSIPDSAPKNKQRRIHRGAHKHCMHACNSICAPRYARRVAFRRSSTRPRKSRFKDSFARTNLPFPAFVYFAFVIIPPSRTGRTTLDSITRRKQSEMEQKTMRTKQINK